MFKQESSLFPKVLRRAKLHDLLGDYIDDSAESETISIRLLKNKKLSLKKLSG